MRPRSFSPHAFALAAATAALLGLLDGEPAEAAKPRGCPEGMVRIRGQFCVDKFEASTVEVLPGGKTRKHSPFEPVKGLKVKAVSKRGVKPQAHISRNEAAEACQNAGKRLCTDDEWLMACRGKVPTTWPYGKEHRQGACNDRGVSSFNHYYGSPGAEAPKESYTWANMNDARLNKLEGTLAPTGSFKKCRNGFDVYDMVGNLHEWTKSGAFRGGYYLDTLINGEGCEYKTTAHSAKYHDYSTGFRCCK
jgi:formylglycine-generating enzyme